MTEQELATLVLTMPDGVLSLMTAIDTARMMGHKYANSNYVRAEYIARLFNLSSEAEDAIAYLLIESEQA